MLMFAVGYFWFMTGWKTMGNEGDFYGELKKTIDGLNKDLGWSI